MRLDERVQLGRECGDCTLCCKLLAIEELGKPGGTWCVHCTPGTGCNVYETRPGECRQFDCLWLANRRFGPHWKPNKCKMVMVGEAQGKIVVYVDQGAAGPWQDPYLSDLRRLSALGLVLVVNRGRTTVVLPDRNEDLGVLGHDDRIVLTPRPDGRLDATIVKERESPGRVEGS